MKKKTVSSIDLAYLFKEQLKKFSDCSPRISIAVVPTKDGWTVVTDGWANFKNPLCSKRIELVHKQLRDIYVLAKD
jgi:hypothetical protein